VSLTRVRRNITVSLDDGLNIVFDIRHERKQDSIESPGHTTSTVTGIHETDAGAVEIFDTTVLNVDVHDIGTQL
jgi:hypothetical protein